MLRWSAQAVTVRPPMAWCNETAVTGSKGCDMVEELLLLEACRQACCVCREVPYLAAASPIADPLSTSHTAR
ncbi:hypothetical protein LFM09_48655 [Lentzea alba]